MKSYSLFFILFILLFSNLQAQIETGKKNNSKKKVKILDSTEEKISTLSLYLDYNYGFSFRKLKKNGDFYGEEIGERVNEKAIKTSNFGLGLEQKFSKMFVFSFGLNATNFGEKYQETTSDSLLNYTRKYSYLGVPIQLGFVKNLNKTLSLAFKTGLQIQFLRSYKNTNIFYVDGNKQEITSKKTDDLNTNSIASASTLRLEVASNKLLRIYVGGSYVHQLNSTYNKQQDYIHKPYLFSGNVGFIIRL